MAFDPASGQVAFTFPWRSPKLESVNAATPVVVGDRVLLSIYASSGSGSGDAELRAVSLETGQVLWGQPGLGRATLLFADGHLIVLTEFGRLYLRGKDRLAAFRLARSR